MADRNDEMHVSAPRMEWKWQAGNWLSLLNLAILIGGGGWFASEQNSRLTQNEGSITLLAEDVRRLETTGRILDNHELRIERVENQATDAAAALRAVEQSLSSLASDMRLTRAELTSGLQSTREILERLEHAQNGRREP